MSSFAYFWLLLAVVLAALRIWPASAPARVLLHVPGPQPFDGELEWRFVLRSARHAFDWAAGGVFFQLVGAFAIPRHIVEASMSLQALLWFALPFITVLAFSGALLHGVHALRVRAAQPHLLFSSSANSFVLPSNQPLHPDALTRAGERRR